MSNPGGVWESFIEADSGLGLKIKDQLIAMVREADAESDRSQQVDLGPSEIGNPCSYHLARRILNIPEEEGDPWCRTIGTATHGWLEEAAVRYNVRHNHAVFTAEGKVYPDAELLPSGGSADLYHTEYRAVIDHKVIGKPQQTKYRSKGPGQQYRNQVHLYGLGYSMAGLPVDNVAIAFWLRGGRLSDLYVWIEEYDPMVAQAALDRYRTLRDLVHAAGEAVLDHLPRHAECYRCSAGGEFI